MIILSFLNFLSTFSKVGDDDRETKLTVKSLA